MKWHSECRGMQFRTIAMRYYPDLGYKAALRRFRQEIVDTKGLLQALQETGYRANQRYFTPRQVQVIKEFLGEA